MSRQVRVTQPRVLWMAEALIGCLETDLEEECTTAKLLTVEYRGKQQPAAQFHIVRHGVEVLRVTVQEVAEPI